MKLDWSKMLIIAMGLFILFVVWMGVKMATSNQSLYETDYYEVGERHTERMNQVKEAQNVDVVLVRGNNNLKITFDSIGYCSQVKLLHLANSANDKRLEFKIDKPSKQQIVQLTTLVPGIWVMEVEGLVNGKAFYYKKQVVL